MTCVVLKRKPMTQALTHTCGFIAENRGLTIWLSCRREVNSFLTRRLCVLRMRPRSLRWSLGQAAVWVLKPAETLLLLSLPFAPPSPQRLLPLWNSLLKMRGLRVGFNPVAVSVPERWTHYCSLLRFYLVIVEAVWGISGFLFSHT